MRLSCPNCGAQYEVPVEVIPQDGRDVQCSNCGHTWFQLHPDQDVDLAQETGGSLPDQSWSPEEVAETVQQETDLVEDPVMDEHDQEVQPPEPRFDDEPSADSDLSLEDEEEDPQPEEPPVEPEEDVADEASEDADHAEPDVAEETEDEVDDEEDPADLDEEEAETPRSPRGIDPAIADVLRQEAEYEANARESEAQEALETQTELGLQDPGSHADDQRAAEARERMRRIQGLNDGSDDADASPEVSSTELDDAAHASRRDLLPDIDEINSTLRAADDRGGAEGTVAAVTTRERKRSGFRLGFGLVLLFAALVIMAYIYNREIAAAFPAMAPAVDTLMETLNAMRVWLDTRVTEAMLWLDGMAESAGGETE
ncbi:zinc-ribbon domain-containing protein [uncultured Shimia sp.]|uniref:zinc-ribbon domain-containing protein n=1 Tax=uncultured Shimia sp. TaxID=573152 RepID=UPI00260DA425|nr:zinc-ribbon domain-containing protein [uncultured Shimia sp.]